MAGEPGAPNNLCCSFSTVGPFPEPAVGTPLSLLLSSRGAASQARLKIALLVRVFHEASGAPYLPAAVLAGDEVQMEQQPPGAAPRFPVAGQDPGLLSPEVTAASGLAAEFGGG